MDIRIAQFLLPLVDDPKIVSFPFREHLLESRLDLLIKIVEQGECMLSRQTDFVPGEHFVGAHDQPCRPDLFIRIYHADHAAVTEVVAVADRLLSLTPVFIVFSNQNIFFLPSKRWL